MTTIDFRIRAILNSKEITIIPIHRNTLTQMQNILSLSAGYQISMEDELRYFDPNNSMGWLLAKNEQNQTLGFIRHFKQSSDWSLVEFYVDFDVKNRTILAQDLVAEFKKKAHFPTGHRMRFDVLKNDSELNDVIESAGFSQKVQLFRHFQMSVNNLAIQDHQNIAPINIRDVASCFLHLNPVTESEVRGWIAEGQIRTVLENSQVVAAAQIFISEDFIEINRIATHPQSLRRGNAERLIQRIYSEAIHKGKKLIFLKVENIREPAIALYKKSGFVEIENKAQLWHSFWH